MAAEEEIWKDIPGYEGYYQVSSFGRVKSVDRISYKNGIPLNLKGKILKIRRSSNGYISVVLSKDAVRKSSRTHLLVALSFWGYKRIGNKLDVNHIDGNRENNNLSNLEIVTHRDNCSVCYRSDKIGSTSKFVGVSWSKERKKWVAQIGINGKQTSLGRYTNEEDAAAAYQNALLFLNRNKHD